MIHWHYFHLCLRQQSPKSPSPPVPLAKCRFFCANQQGKLARRTSTGWCTPTNSGWSWRRSFRATATSPCAGRRSCRWHWTSLRDRWAACRVRPVRVRARLTQQTCKACVQGRPKVAHFIKQYSKQKFRFSPSETQHACVSLFAPFVCHISPCRVFMLNFFMVLVQCFKFSVCFSQKQLGFGSRQRCS